MPAIRTDVFVIPLLGRYVVYAPLRRVAFIANAAAVNLLERLRRGEVEPANEEQARFLRTCDQIHLTGDEGDVPITTLDWGSFQPTEVTLFLTTRCNLRCLYCYAEGGERPPADMSLETAQRGIDLVCRNALERGTGEFGVGYHGGGEPTMNWEVLTQSFAYAQRLARQHGLRVYGSMATNGVLSREQRRWIVRNLAGVNLSVDGLPAVQDRQRPRPSGRGSSAVVLETMRAFDRAGFRYGLRITVTAAGVDRLAEGVGWLLEHGHPERIQVEPMYVLGRGRRTNLAVDPQAFVLAFLEAQPLAEARGVDYFYSAARVDVLTNRFCQSCGEGFSLTPEGLVSACYEVPGSDFEYGDRFIFGRFDEAAGRYAFDEHKLAHLRAHTVEGIAWCRDCFCKWHCGGDCAYKTLHEHQGSGFAGSLRCEITRALTLEQILRKIDRAGGELWAGNA